MSNNLKSRVMIGETGPSKGFVLPDIKNPTEEVILPGSGKKVVIRPFTLQTEKALLVAREKLAVLLKQKQEHGIRQTTDEEIEAIENLLRVIGEVIVGCVVTPPDFNPFNEFVGDIEYLFMRIRALSAGEQITVTIKCPNCGNEMQVAFDLNDVKVEVDKEAIKTKKVKIPVELGWVELQIRPPTYQDFIEIAKINADADALFLADYLWVVTERAITSDGDEFIPRNDIELDAWRNWISQLSVSIVDKIMSVIDGFQHIKCDVDVTCPKCQHQETIDLCGENATSFFT